MMTGMTDQDRIELKRRFGEFSKYGRKFDRAIDNVLAGGVKEIRFLPSGRRFFTVVGKLGDEFIDPERPYCSCSNFYFEVLGGRDEICYHLLSYRIASRLGKVEVTEFSDEEYSSLLKAIVGDVFSVLGRS
jgi:predicted nucleic acid-binding Zn finger protein